MSSKKEGNTGEESRVTRKENQSFGTGDRGAMTEDQKKCQARSTG